jgi:hypothetical protein
VYLPEDAPWLGEFMSELLALPNGRHDDQVDSVSQFLFWWQCGASTPTRRSLRQSFSLGRESRFRIRTVQCERPHPVRPIGLILCATGQHIKC